MSKQSDAKAAQGYTTAPAQCSNCAAFRSVVTEEQGDYGPWRKETLMRCHVGKFAVNKTAVCKLFVRRLGKGQ